MKKILIVVLIITIVLGCYGYLSMDMYTDEQHLASITEKYNERISRYTYSDGGKVDNFTVYPLYNEKEELSMFLIEMEPYGFEFVMVKADDRFFDMLLSCNGRSMYRMSFKDYGFDGVYDVWEKYNVNEENGERVPILNENGERVFYRNSPFYVSGHITERKYLIQTKKTYYIFAIKKGGEFINLISGKIVDIKNTKTKDLYNKQATLQIDYLDYPNFEL